MTNASTFLASTAIGLLLYGIFIDGINNVYVPSRLSNVLLVWSQSRTTIRNVSVGSNRSMSVFVTINGDIYIDNGYTNGRVDKFASNMTSTAMTVNGTCYGLFVDLNKYLYCSMKDYHQVIKLLLNSSTTIPTVAAGIGSPGSTSTMLNSQQGIYVDSNINLYVADCGNDRIQLFQSGQLTAVTVLGNGSSNTDIILRCPTHVVLDNDGYLFVVDSYNHRIIGSSWNGSRCVVGCSGSGGVASTQLSFPQTMGFDSYGNIYVTDRNNSRIQKFTFIKTNCSKLYMCYYTTHIIALSVS